MHETAIAHAIIEEAKKHGKVESVELELGELGHVPPQELVECIERLVPWKVVWSEKKAVVKCTCGFHGHPKVIERGHDHFMIECPRCGETPQLLSGTEFKIIKVVVE